MDYSREQLNNYLTNIAIKVDNGSMIPIKPEEYDSLIERVQMEIKFKQASYTETNGICFILIENVEFEEEGLKQCDGKNILLTSETFNDADMFIGNIIDGTIVASSSSGME